MKIKVIIPILLFTVIILCSTVFVEAKTFDSVISDSSQYRNVYMLIYQVKESFYNGYSNSFTLAGYHILIWREDYTRDVIYNNNFPYVYLNSNKFFYHSFNGSKYDYDNFTEYDVAGYFNVAPSYASYLNSRYIGEQKLIVYKGSINGTKNDNVFTDYDDYIESIQPTWWERVAQIFTEFATSPAMGAVISGDWLGYINEVLFGDLWTVKVGEGEDEIVQFNTVSATPSPSPTPTPTQIPVQVNIDPTNGNVTYHYTIDVSGTPVPTSSPVNPNPPAGTGGGGSELTEPFGVTDYYEPDDSLSIPNLRIFQFQLDLPGSNTDIGVDSLDNNVEVMNGYLEDNADAITTVSSFFQVIPSDWFLLLGAIACFPIIAAMIKSLLGG